MDEFIVDRSKVHIIDQVKGLIEGRFNVAINYSDVVKEGNAEKQWIGIRGADQHGMVMAKEYLKTLCNAEEKLRMRFPERITPLLKQAHNYQRIEEQSDAVILFVKDGEIDIFGTDIAITLAMSAVEDFVSRYDTEQPEVGESDTDDMKKQSDARLDSQLRVVCEKHDLPYEDYCNTPSTLKRTLLSWLSNDMDKTGDENIKLPEDVVTDAVDDSVVITGVKLPTNDCVIIEGHPSSKMTTASASTMGPKVRLFASDPSAEQSLVDVVDASPMPESPTAQTLRQFALSKGYTNEEIDTVLSENPNIRLSSIIHALHLNRTRKAERRLLAGVEPMDVEEIADTSERQVQDTYPKPAATSSSSQSLYSSSSKSAESEISVDKTTTSQGVGELKADIQQNLSVNADYDKSVIDYLKQLNKHFDEETSDLPREVLLKNNAERQNILKQAYEKAEFDRSKNQSQDAAGTSAPRPQSRNRKKKKRMRKKKQASAAAASQPEPTAAASASQAEPTKDAEMPEVDDDDGDSGDESPDVIVEDEEVNVVSVQKPSTSDYATARSPRPQISQNPKKARQENGTGRDTHSSDADVSSSASVSSRPPATFPSTKKSDHLRPIVIDGSNVAMNHGNNRVFSCKGIKIAIEYFLKRGHTEITAFVPNWRRGGFNCPKPTVGREILDELENKGQLSFTPSRYVNGKKIVCYDDRFIVELAAQNDGVIVSNDNYRDLMNQKPVWNPVITERLLMYTFAGDHFMVPDDPMGKFGPTLDMLLMKPDVNVNPNWAYRGANRYANPWIPAGPAQTAVVNPQAGTRPHFKPRGLMAMNPTPRMQQPLFAMQQQQPLPKQQPLLPRQQPIPNRQQPPRMRQPPPPSQTLPPRPEKVTKELSTQLLQIFPDTDDAITRILTNHPHETDLNKLSAFILDAMN